MFRTLLRITLSPTSCHTFRGLCFIRTCYWRYSVQNSVTPDNNFAAESSPSPSFEHPSSSTETISAVEVDRITLQHNRVGSPNHLKTVIVSHDHVEDVRKPGKGRKNTLKLGRWWEPIRTRYLEHVTGYQLSGQFSDHCSHALENRVRPMLWQVISQCNQGPVFPGKGKKNTLKLGRWGRSWIESPE